MPRRWYLAALGAALACGGGVMSSTPTDATTETDSSGADAASEASADVPGFGDGSSGGDEPWDAAGWLDQFADANFFDGENPPLPGEFPPSGGDCTQFGGCPTGGCDLGTGWCCSGTYKHRDCACGESWGCVPPQECCVYPDAMVPVCAPSADACPSKYPP